MRARGRSHGEDGFTLVEITIAALLLLLGLSLSASLLIEAQSAMARSHAETVGATPADLALARFARDVREARPPFAGGGTDELVLHLAEGTVRWRQVDGCLARRTDADEGADDGTDDCVLRRVVGWQWRALSSHRLQMTVTVAEIEATPGAARLADLRHRPLRPGVRRLEVSAAARASGGRRGRW